MNEQTYRRVVADLLGSADDGGVRELRGQIAALQETIRNQREMLNIADELVLALRREVLQMCGIARSLQTIGGIEHPGLTEVLATTEEATLNGIRNRYSG